MEAFRTPEERFEGLPDFGYQPSYRAAHGIQEDQGPVVGRLISDWLSGGP